MRRVVGTGQLIRAGGGRPQLASQVMLEMRMAAHDVHLAAAHLFDTVPLSRRPALRRAFGDFAAAMMTDLQTEREDGWPTAQTVAGARYVRARASALAQQAAALEAIRAPNAGGAASVDWAFVRVAADRLFEAIRSLDGLLEECEAAARLEK